MLGYGSSLHLVLVQSWTRDGGIPQGCRLSMMFIVALYLPWCRYLSAQVGVWASARMGQLEDWFKSWVPDSVFSAGGGRGSVEAWYTSALVIEEVLMLISLSLT